MGPADEQSSKSRSDVRSRRRSKSRPRCRIELYYEQFLRLRRDPRLYRDGARPRLIVVIPRANEGPHSRSERHTKYLPTSITPLVVLHFLPDDSAQTHVNSPLTNQSH